MNRSGIGAILFVYWGYLFIVTFYPFELSPVFTPSINHLATAFQTVARDSWVWLGKTDFILNVLLFLPCGVLLYGLWENRRWSKLSTIVVVTLCGASVSYMIEFGQVFVSRDTSGFDIVANTLGTTVGALLYAQCKQRGIDLTARCAEYLSSWVGVCCALIWGALPLVFSAEQILSPFSGWDSGYNLQIGNETTMKRPWLGKIYLVALYRRALSRDEVVNNFSAGLGPEALTRRAKDALIALYTFSEGAGNIVRDSSRFGPSLDLRFSPGPRVRWLDASDGIEIVKGSIVRSQGPATKLVDALKESSELSLEVWMAPNNTLQQGPARIVSLSRDSGARNFTLGQEKADIHFRLRTPASGKNGTPVVLQTSNGVLNSEPSHVVVTYESGIERLYVNGKQRPESINLLTDGIIGFATKKMPTAQIAYSFFYFLPVAFVLSAFFSTRSDVAHQRWLYAMAVAVGLSTATEWVQALAIARSVDIPIVGYGLIVSLVGGLSGRAFVGAERWL